MFEITHQEAQRLLHKFTDQILMREDLSILNAHLENCVGCSDYAKNLIELESGLRRILHTAIDSRSPHLNMQAILSSTTNFKKFPWVSIFDPTQIQGRVTMSIALILGCFIVTNLIGGQLLTTSKQIPTFIPTPHNLPITNNLSPTPSTPSTMILATAQECKTVNYVLQDNETLENIAVQFGVSKKLILTFNNLKPDDVFPGKELSIPLCDQTPSLIASTTQNAITITPSNEIIHPNQ